MTTDTQIEQRLRAVEEAISEIQHRAANPISAVNWIEQIIGSFKNEPAFEEVIEFGRAIRSADQPIKGVYE